MEPRIQYAKAKDGVSIAFWTLGAGPPLVQTPVAGESHIRLQWQIPEFCAIYERLAQKRMFVQYDCRGAGLSERGVTDFSLGCLVQDLEAVVQELRLEKFALWGQITLGPVAICYAVHHPEQVSHHVLSNSYARASDFFESREVVDLARLIDNWELYTDTLAHWLFGWSAAEQGQRWAELMREGITQETYRAAYEALREFDVSALLPQVRSPTLVLQRQPLPWLDVGVARALASQIPGARLALLEGASPAFTLHDIKSVEEFLGEGEPPAAALPPAPGGFATILFTDMESSTALRR